MDSNNNTNHPNSTVQHYIDDIVITYDNNQSRAHVVVSRDALAERTELTDHAVFLCALLVYEDNPTASVDARLHELAFRLQYEGIILDRERLEQDLRRLFRGTLEDAYLYTFQ